MNICQERRASHHAFIHVLCLDHECVHVHAHVHPQHKVDM